MTIIVYQSCKFLITVTVVTNHDREYHIELTKLPHMKVVIIP